jgi:hypothetical protein
MRLVLLFIIFSKPFFKNKKRFAAATINDLDNAKNIVKLN